MTIEQTLMRNMKTSGGLIHGRGTSDSMRSQWILGATISSRVCREMEEFAGVLAFQQA